jgi:Putative lumazine-binding
MSLIKYSAISSIFIATSGAIGLPLQTPEASINTYFKATETNNTLLLADALHPISMMYWNGAEKLEGLSGYGWQSKMRSTPIDTSQTIDNQLEWIDAGTDSAIVRTKAIRGKNTYIDYLLLARVEKNWRIIGKVFSEAKPLLAKNTQAVRNVIENKIKSDASWDARLFETTIHPRALVFTLENTELVAASVAEWSARYEDRKQKHLSSESITTIDRIDISGDVAAVRWTAKWNNDAIYVDRAILLNTNGQWKMMALIFTRE